MKRIALHLALLGSLPALHPGLAQTHKVAKPESVVRAVGVYEWTGDLAKPTASRLIPVSLAINGSLEDAGVYLARPIPFALQPGDDYILQDAGVDRGSLDLLFARHLQAADSAYEDGWFGYGTYKPLAPPPKQRALRASKPPAIVVGADSSGRPHLTRKDDSSTTSTAASTTSTDKDPDRPHLTRKEDASANTPTDPAKPVSGDTDTAPATTASSSPSDPDRPTMHRRNTDSSTGSTTDTASGNTPAEDPDRPTLKRHNTDSGEKSKSGNETASVSGLGSLNADPDRPTLHRGKPASAMTEEELPKLTGLPSSLHQMVAVSDAVNRPEHSFSRPWEDDAEHASVLQAMQDLARAQLAISAAAAKPKPATSPASKPAVATRRPVHPAHAAPVPEPLLEEDLKAFTLSYGGAPTFVYTAHTAGEGATLRYVTVVAEKDAMGTLKPALRSTTDAAHLDRTPRLRLVDVVDADASNRASLLFELRAQNSRQFALYRVLGARADQTLITGSTQ